MGTEKLLLHLYSVYSLLGSTALEQTPINCVTFVSEQDEENFPGVSKTPSLLHDMYACMYFVFHLAKCGSFSIS